MVDNCYIITLTRELALKPAQRQGQRTAEDIGTYFEDPLGYWPKMGLHLDPTDFVSCICCNATQESAYSMQIHPFTRALPLFCSLMFYFYWLPMVKPESVEAPSNCVHLCRGPPILVPQTWLIRNEGKMKKSASCKIKLLLPALLSYQEIVATHGTGTMKQTMRGNLVVEALKGIYQLM